MKPSERQHVVERYAARLGKLGPVVQALGWRDEAQQALRFNVMADGLPALDGASILDIGCGFGDFYRHLRDRGHHVTYTGCDLSPDVLAVARSRHPDAIFEVRDVLDQPYPERSFDVVCMSGIFNHRIEDNEGFLRSMLGTAFRSCRKAVTANMTTDHVDYQDPHLYYFNPESVFHHCRSLTRRLALRHEYPLYEFTIFLYTDAAA